MPVLQNANIGVCREKLTPKLTPTSRLSDAVSPQTLNDFASLLTTCSRFTQMVMAISCTGAGPLARESRLSSTPSRAGKLPTKQ